MLNQQKTENLPEESLMEADIEVLKKENPDKFVVQINIFHKGIEWSIAGVDEDAFKAMDLVVRHCTGIINNAQNYVDSLDKN